MRVVGIIFALWMGLSNVALATPADECHGIIEQATTGPCVEQLLSRQAAALEVELKLAEDAFFASAQKIPDGQRIKHNLPNPLPDLQKAQADWREWRESECEVMAALSYQRGTGLTALMLGCRIELTTQRIATLKSYIPN